MDELVRETAEKMRQAVRPWPDFEPPQHVCAMLEMSSTTQARLFINPNHACPDPDSMFTKAAVLALEYYTAAGPPDEGWWAATNGVQGENVWCTYILERAVVGEQSGLTIPVSELPPL